MCFLTHSMRLMTHGVPSLPSAVCIFLCFLVPERSANWGCAGCTSGHALANCERAGTSAARGTSRAVQVSASGGLAPDARLVQRPLRPVLRVWRRAGLTCRPPRPHIEALLNYSRVEPPFCVRVVYVEACGRPCMFLGASNVLQVLQAPQAPWHVHGA